MLSSTSLLKCNFFISISHFVWFSNFFSLLLLFPTRNLVFLFQVFKYKAPSNFLVLQLPACSTALEARGGLCLSNFLQGTALMTFFRQLDPWQCFFTFIFLGHLLAYKMLRTEGDICLLRKEKRLSIGRT